MERNMTFPWNKETLKLCLKDYIGRSYHFLVEITCKDNKKGIWSKYFSWHNQKYFINEENGLLSAKKLLLGVIPMINEQNNYIGGH